MKIKILLLSLILTSMSFAQKNLSVTWGPELKLQGKSWISRVVGSDDSYFYALRVPRKGINDEFWIEKYGINNMKMISSYEIELPQVGRKTVDYQDLRMFNGEFLLITSFYDKKADMKYAFAQTITKSGKLNSKATEIGRVAGKRKNTTGFGFEVSSDHSKFLVYQNEENTKDANERFAYTMYDADLNKLWKKNVEVEHSDRYFTIFDYTIDEEGNVYALNRIYPDRYRGEQKKGRKMQQYNYSVLIYNPEKDETRQFKVDLGPAKFVSEIEYALTADGNMAIVGFYSKEDASSMDGTFFIKLDPDDMSMASKNMKEFDRDFMLEFLKERKVNKGEELSNFDFKDILLRDDGGFYIVAEQEYWYTTTSVDANGNTTVTYHYVANDMIVIDIDIDGNIQWTKKIPKSQHTTNDGGEYLSYAMAYTDEQMHFIYNDHPKNVDRLLDDPDDWKTMNKPKKSVTMMVSMDQRGEYIKGPLFKSKDFGTILQPKLNYTPGNSELIIYGEKGSKYKFGRIKFTNFN